MKIIRRINHNAALALDGNGKELVVLGKGVGFPQTPYELTDLSKISKTFYDVNPYYMDMIASIPQPMLLASADIVEQAEINLDCELNPNMAFTLADHLNFAMERMRKGIDFISPIAYDVEHFYPEEYELGVLALDIVEDYMGCRLPDSEALHVALHIINGEVENADVHSVLVSIQIMADINAMIEKELGIEVDKNSFEYSRFKTHFIYLIERLSTGKLLQGGVGNMLEGLAVQYPDIYECAVKITDYLEKENSWKCSKDEILYLMLHINRLKEKIGME